MSEMMDLADYLDSGRQYLSDPNTIEKYKVWSAEIRRCSADSAELEARLALADELMLPGGTHPYLGARKRDMIVAALRARAQPQAAPLTDVLASCKIEHKEFEKWAEAEKYDMHEHPLHYLFMDTKTNAARQGWKAALRYVASQVSRPAPQPMSMPAAAQELAAKHDWCPSCHRGWNWRGSK